MIKEIRSFIYIISRSIPLYLRLISYDFLMIFIYLIDFRNIKKMNETEMDETYRARARACIFIIILLFYIFRSYIV